MIFFFNRYFSRKAFAILLSESALILVVSFALLFLRLYIYGSVPSYEKNIIKMLVLTSVYIISFVYFDLYSDEFYHPGRNMYLKLFGAIALATVALFAIQYIIPFLKTWRTIVVGDIIAVPVAIIIWRSFFTRFLHLTLPVKRVLIIGADELAKKIGATIYNDRGYGLELVGFIDDDPVKKEECLISPGVIGGYGDIATIVAEQGIDRIIIALADRRAKLPMSVLLDCKLSGISIEEAATFNERMSGKISVDNLKPSWMVFSDGFKSLRSRKIVKRILDIFLASTLLVVTAPIFLITALFVKLESHGPIIFKQLRVGEHGKEFNIYKFRSMRTDAEEGSGPVWAESNDDRITRVGRVIRAVRIDELPQLINVLSGAMSFVGPRPERMYFVRTLVLDIPYYNIRSVVKPGITGWAQINYPYGATVEDAIEKLQYDIYYIKNMSPLLDLMICFWTIKVVLTSHGAR